MQISKLLGAKVVAVTSGADKAVYLKRLGNAATYPYVMLQYPADTASLCCSVSVLSCLQISKLLGAKVVAVTSGADKADGAEMR
jgi:NADPH-dependent curcumin reductase CurA